MGSPHPTTTTPRGANAATSTLSIVVTACLGMLTVLVAWQAAVWLLAPPRFVLPAPADVFSTFIARRAFLAEHAAITLYEILLGLLFGTATGVATALGVAAFPRLGRAVWPVVLVFQALPVFAIAPLLVVWFGFGLASKIVMTSLIIFFPVASAFGDALRRTDPDILDACRVDGSNHWRTLWNIRVPLALPGLVTGLRVAAPLAPLGAIVGEWVGASGGLGFIMLQSNARMQTADVFAALAVVAALALILRAIVDVAAPRIAPWAQEIPAESAVLLRNNA